MIHGTRALLLTVGILFDAITVATSFDRSLEENWGQGVHGNINSEIDKSE
jgi:hypothetical protein